MRKPTTIDAEPHMVVSHGADFFGQDRHPLKVLASLAGYAEGCLPRAERGPLVELLKDPEAGTIAAAEAAVVSGLLLRVARHGWVKGPAAAHARALADSAARAADAGEPWEWHRES
ncbi:hypothetical protein ABT391_37330 [Streptomyces jumonjinensis]|uniref:DUF7739 domain-containing protein n=1 Tax=Streptomyces jumonjinensis TaxID=1945 RepID=UPI00332714A1